MSSQSKNIIREAPADSPLAASIATLAEMPHRFEAMFRQVPAELWHWEPATWDGIPGESFSAAGQACHVRDIEVDGYQVRIRRMLDEDRPDLASLDGYALAREREYGQADPLQAIAEFRTARRATVGLLSRIDESQWTRRGIFAEYGEITLRGLIYYLCSHDQQHLACLQWLLGRLASDDKLV